MSEEMGFEEEIIKLAESDPFTPFSLTLTSGQRIEVTQHHQLAVGSGNTVLLVHPRGGLTIIRKNQIATVEEPEPD